MAFLPFGKELGPSMNTRPSVVRPSFGSRPQSPSPTTPPPPMSGPQIQRAPSPASAFQNNFPSFRPHQPSEVQRGPEHGGATPSPPLALNHSEPFGKSYQFPGIQRAPETSPISDATRPASSPNPLIRNHRPIQAPYSLGDRPSSLKESGGQSHPSPSARQSYVVSRNVGNNAAEIGPFRGRNIDKSPPLLSADDVSRNSQPPYFQRSSAFPARKRSPQSAFGNNQYGDDFCPPSTQTRRQSPSSMENRTAKFTGTHRDQPPNSSYIDSYEPANVPVFGTKKSFPVAPSDSVYQDISKAGQYNHKRPSISPPALRTSGNTSFHKSLDIEKPVTYANDRLGPTTRSTSFSTPKTISSSLLSAEEDFLGKSGSSQDGTEREDQAKAKRLARFKGELGSLPTRAVDTADKKLSINKTLKPSQDKHKVPSVEPNREAIKLDTMSDSERLEPPSVIAGLCPDMCPESEREERERKGDLDKYERVDGDRNQTSKYLAVKKYTRTAERESILIRPMPVLQETMDYLLDLLDQPYDDSFLGMYNFLWDRMRAIRMDLRMQHIFNEEAITMLEKMIRLHIIAMHELCEFTKGEGFAEGFDAHLNIEQMNKTSVELFQLYDDHTKRGIAIPTEKEFRGYYALLKLDKHPGYKVEPAELSLDLARMTPEIRQTPEVLFARNVARACRTGNFIAFFRLARKASYLQACLMHAHFAKLRTQALASLHSGLLNNQGLPVSDVSKWIGMEEENIETLLDYHGYSVKEFEEPYIVKDGPFLNADKDYPTRCSRLVHMKKLRRIVEDVSPSSPLLPLISVTRKDTTEHNLHKHDPLAIPDLKKQSSFRAMDEDIPCSRTPSPKVDKQQTPLTVKPMVDQHHDDQQKVYKILSPKISCSPRGSPRFSPAMVRSMEQPNKNSRFSLAETKSMGEPNSIIQLGTFPEENKFPGAQAMPTKTATEPALQRSFSKTMPIEIMPKALVHESPQRREDEYSLMGSGEERKKDDFEDEKLLEVDVEKEDENGPITSQHDKEVAEAKLKLIIRLWKRWSSRQREFREQRQLAATAALNSLSLGPPIRLSKDDQPSESGEFDIDHAMRTRSEKHEQSWSRVNVSNVTVDTLSEKNPDSKCLCWKIVLCSSMDSVKMGSQASISSASRWLLSKLMPSKETEDVDHDLLLSSSGMSIWSKWVQRQYRSDLICCLSVVRHLKVDSDLHETVSGASGVVFLVSENVPWSLQKNQLNNLLKAIPSGSCLPLLIISDSYKGDCSDPTTAIVNELDLHHIDRAKVSSFSVLSLIDDCEKGKADNFFSDKQLRGGLKWLAGNSPLQPVLHCHKPRELVLNHLSALLDLLGKMPSNEVGPNLCISAFNEALDRALGKITSAIESNPVSWPCSEIELLEGSRNEHLMVKWHLPSVGWSSAERTGRLKSFLQNLKIPAFHDNLTWLTIGCGTGSELENQRTRLERCLIEYLSETGKLMEDTLAAKEACVMLQRNTTLELQKSSYYIVPKWVMIFRRIFNWRLIGLSDTAFSSVYILKSDFDASTLGYMDKPVVDEDLCMSYPPNLPSLDEMIEIGFQAEPNSFKPLPMPSMDNGAQETANSGELIGDRQDDMAVVGDDDDDNEMASATHELENGKDNEKVNRRVSTEADRLRELLEKCNIVQNKIAKKLSVYF